MTTSKAQLLIVEDEPEIAELIEFHAERAGMRARTIHSGRLALEVLRREKPDLVILDLMLPDLDGLEVCRRMKQNEDTRSIPIVMVTAKGEEADVVAGIELGAEDYVTKPFSPRVLMARLRNVLRRHGQVEETPTRAERLVLLGGRLVIDIDRHEVVVESKKTDLTLTEFGILHYLASRPGFVRTRDQIIAAVHGKSTVLSSRTVDVHVTALRRKLDALSECVETVRGVGYRFSEGSDESQD
jgi:two-component system phosphate regulon response regulator PhoB